MRYQVKTFASVLIGGLLVSSVPTALGQQQPPKSDAHPSAPMTHSSPPMTSAPAPSATAPGQQRGRQVVVVEPIRVFDPFFEYPYPYAYPPDYMTQNFGYVKLKTDVKDASVYVDGGFADKIEKAKKFALRPGNHEIELRDSDGRTLFQEKVAVLVGKTTELRVG